MIPLPPQLQLSAAGARLLAKAAVLIVLAAVLFGLSLIHI